MTKVDKKIGHLYQFLKPGYMFYRHDEFLFLHNPLLNSNSFLNSRICSKKNQLFFILHEKEIDEEIFIQILTNNGIYWMRDTIFNFKLYSTPPLREI